MPTEPEPSENDVPDLLDEHAVVRGGEMRQADLERSVEVHFELHGAWALSLWSFPDLDAQQIAVEVGVVAEELGIRLLPNPRLRWALAGDLRTLGYDLEPGGGPRGHITLTFAARPDAIDWNNLEQVFSPPERNPIANRRRP